MAEDAAEIGQDQRIPVLVQPIQLIQLTVYYSQCSPLTVQIAQESDWGVIDHSLNQNRQLFCQFLDYLKARENCLLSLPGLIIISIVHSQDTFAKILES